MLNLTILVSSKTNEIKLNNIQDTTEVLPSQNTTISSSSIDKLENISKILDKFNLSDLNQTYSKKVEKLKTKNFKEKDKFLLNLFEPTFPFLFPKNIDEIPSDLEVIRDKIINKSIKEQTENNTFGDVKENKFDKILKEIELNKSKNLKFSDEVKKKIGNITNIYFKNKIKPKLISQKELNLIEFFEMVEKEPEFAGNYEYAKELGFNELNKSTRIKYDDGNIITVSILLSNNKTGVYLVNLEGNLSSDDLNITSFLSTLKVENNTVILTMFGEDWGVELDLVNRLVVKDWGHHSCVYGKCVGYCFEYWEKKLFWLDYFCEEYCFFPNFGCVDLLQSTGLNPYSIPICIPCMACLTGAAGITGGCLASCAENACNYYPCQYDCNDGDYYNNWEYYCKGNERWKQRKFSNWECSSYLPMEGYCYFASSYYTDDDYIQTCPYGCSNGECQGAITCYNDLECGADGWINNPSCSGGDVWQYYRTYDCHYPGTDSSYCTYSQGPQLKQECVSGSCSSGQCVGDYYCEQQNPPTPWYCNGVCAGCAGGNDEYYVCCPNSGEPTTCCDRNGPFCDTSTGSCDICGGDYPYECNNDCWNCGGNPDYELCCPASGNPQYCCYSAVAVCMSNGECCAPSAETCNNVDDDCNGVIDNYNEGCGVGACAGGIRTCSAGSWGACSTADESSSETCNNIDDDCDGSIDENITQECGTDTGDCIKGTQTCSAGSWGSCGGSYVGPTNETCNDIDDNCNGLVDEANVCGDYPNVTLDYPSNNAVFYTDEVSFNCTITDDANLNNVTLYQDINGSFMPNQTQSISGVSANVFFNINNIQQGYYKWNCYACDNDAHCSLGDEVYWFTVNEEGYITTFVDGTFEQNLEYNQAKNQTVYIKIPKDANILNASAVIRGYNISVYNHTETEYFYWINWTSVTHNFNEVWANNMGQAPDNLGWYMNILGISNYNGTFTLNTPPENVTLKIIHLTSSANVSYSPVNITINGNTVAHCFDPGSPGYVTDEWDITSYVQQGTNTIESRLCMNASTAYWVKWNEINSSFEIYTDIYPTDPIVFVNISATNQTSIWNYTGEFSGIENITGFADELNTALDNCINDSMGYCNISLILSSNSVGVLNLSKIEIYYEYPDDPPNVTLITPQNNNFSTTGNVTFNCSAADDKSLANITLYTNISGIWEANQTNNLTGVLNSTIFTINNIPDETKFIWNCLVYDNASQNAWGDANYSINVSLPNTAPTIINLSQYPTSLYRGEDIEIRCAVSDAETENNSLNITIQYQNSTNNGYLNCSNIIYDSTNAWWECNYTTNYSDDDLGSFDFRCDASDGEVSGGGMINNDTVTVLNNNPEMYACQDDDIYIDTSGSGIQISLDDCSFDLEDSDTNLIYQINNQTNSSLINCYINGHNISCNDPMQHQFGESYLEVQVNDTDSGTNISIPQILITVKPLLDTHKFYVKDNSSNSMAWFGDLGNIVLSGNCTSNTTCTAPSDSFIIQNSAGEVVSYIDSYGNLCIETGDCSDQSETCNPTNDAFIIQNSTGSNVSYIDTTGDLCLTGVLIEYGNP